MLSRGAIQYRQRAKQLRDYRGLQFGNITPTDIDGLIEYQNRAYIIIELKFEDAILPEGQRLALERLTDDLSKVKTTICIIGSHCAESETDIDVANTLVVEYRWNKLWQTPKRQCNIRECIELFLARIRGG